MIDSFWEFMLFYTPGGFICGRHIAGKAYESQKEAWEEHKKNYGRHYDSPMSVGFASTLAFVASYVAWPLIYGGWGIAIAINKTPKKVWAALKYVFVKPPPRRIRKERKLAELQERTAKLEKELEL